jgi:hypothetical protein
MFPIIGPEMVAALRGQPDESAENVQPPRRRQSSRDAIAASTCTSRPTKMRSLTANIIAAIERTLIRFLSSATMRDSGSRLENP